MKKMVFGSLLILIVVIGLGFLAEKGLAAPWNQEDIEQLVRGAQLYDDWTKIVEPVPTLTGTQPIWSTQSTNTQSGVDTWRCVSCHGWDYKGADGAFRSGPNYTGFPGIYDARAIEFSEFQALMDGSAMPDHNFSAYLNATDVASLGLFIQNGLIDDNEFIDPVSLKVLGGDLQQGNELYTSACASCHGDDGRQIKFRYEGQDINLGKLAVQDPWRFLHRTRFGTARAPEMVIGAKLGWQVEEGRDVLLYAQTLPTGFEISGTPSIGEQTPGSGAQPGGPANSILTGILTALGAMATGLGFAIILGVLLIGIIFIVVWFLRGRK
jgi:mono/diheme cytochrome c family protein